MSFSGESFVVLTPNRGGASNKLEENSLDSTSLEQFKKNINIVVDIAILSCHNVSSLV